MSDTSDTKTRLDEIEARVEAATQGRMRWAIFDPTRDPSQMFGELLDPGSGNVHGAIAVDHPLADADNGVGIWVSVTGNGPKSEANAKLQAGAYEDLPFLLDLVRTLTEERDRWMDSSTERKLAIQDLDAEHHACAAALGGEQWAIQSDADGLLGRVSRVVCERDALRRILGGDRDASVPSGWRLCDNAYWWHDEMMLSVDQQGSGVWTLTHCVEGVFDRRGEFGSAWDAMEAANSALADVGRKGLSHNEAVVLVADNNNRLQE